MKPLKYRNNWEADVYSVEERTVKSLNRVYVNHNGSVVALDVTGVMTNVDYYDMGRTCTARSMHYFVMLPVFGAEIKTNLRTLIENGVRVLVKEDEVEFQ